MTSEPNKVNLPSNPNNPQKLMWLGLRETWIIAGGMGGLVGAAIVVTLQFLLNLNAVLGVATILLLVFLLLLIGFVRQANTSYRKLAQQYAEVLQDKTSLQKDNQELKRNLADRPSWQDRGILQINRDLLDVAARSNDVSALVKEVEEWLPEKLLQTFSLIRAGWYVPRPGASLKRLEDLEAQLPLSSRAQDSPAHKLAPQIFKLTEMGKILEVLNTHRTSDSGSNSPYSAVYIPILDTGMPNQVSAVLFGYLAAEERSQLWDHVVEPIEKAIVPVLQRAFTEVKMTEQLRAQAAKAQEKSQVMLSHVCGVLRRDAGGFKIDDDLPLEKSQRSLLEHLTEDHHAQIIQAFDTPDPRQEKWISNGTTCLALLPIDDRGQVRNLLVFVDQIDHPNLLEDPQCAGSFARLVRYLRQTFGGEQILPKPEILFRHLDRVIAQPGWVLKMALLAIEFDDLAGFPQDPSSKEEIVAIVAEGIRQWNPASVHDPLTFASSYGPTGFLMCIHSETDENAIGQASGIKTQLGQQLANRFKAEKPPSIVIGVARAAGEISNSKDLLRGARQALQEARQKQERVAFELAGIQSSLSGPGSEDATVNSSR